MDLSTTDGLPVLSCHLRPAPTDLLDQDPRVVLELRSGTELIAPMLVVTASEMKLKPTLAAAATSLGLFGVELPPWAATELGDGIEALPPEDPLWLSIGSPAAHLPGVPWERLLAQVTPKPILRLPYSPVQPVLTRDRIDVAICAIPAQGEVAEPLADHVRRVIGAFRESLPPETRIHVFAVEPETRDAARDAGALLADPAVLGWAAPAETGPLGELATGVPGRIENPWLRWVLEARKPAPTDIVHFVCPGYLSATYGALDMGDPPLAGHGDEASRFVTAGQLIAFLTRAGAWGAGFTMPSRHAWPAGIRILAHRIATLAPGPVLVEAPHYVEDGGDDLSRAVKTLFTDEPAAPPGSAALSLYVQPRRVRERLASGGAGTVLDEAIEPLTLRGSSQEQVLAGGQAPSWLAANQRLMERWAALAVAGTLDAPGSEARQQGVTDALRFVAKVLAEDGEEAR